MIGFYCTAFDPTVPVKPGGRPRVAFILGPYPDKAAADAFVSDARDIADRCDPRAPWWAYGVTRLEADRLPPGRGNDMLNRPEST